ncbi:hypothetical protein ACF1BS_16545 [Streptomyces sp. NPDC014748]|uniref:hypothetical protein n=1 Tax=Streptomyces sp. NPDC014748 TaxID=3364905 RepID=UPI0036F8EE58
MALHAEYTVRARRLGVPPARLVLRHALPNAALPGVRELARTASPNRRPTASPCWATRAKRVPPGRSPTVRQTRAGT